MNTSGEFFNNFADRFDTFYNGKRSPIMQWIDQRFRRDMFVRFAMTFDFLGDLRGKRIVDIGCGSGPYIEEALKRGALHVTGIDPAPRMLALARERVEKLGKLDKLSLVEGYFPHTHPSGSFDLAIVVGVMDYIEDARGFLQSVQSVITQGAVLSFPSTHWLRTPLRNFRYKLRSCPVYFYTDSEIDLLMQQAGVGGYKIVKIPGAGMDFVVWISV